MEDRNISKFKSSISFCLVVAVALLDASVLAQNCYTPNNAIGKCIPINYCQSLLVSFQNPNRGAHQTQYLLNSQCGYLDSTPYFCCPLANQNNGGCIFGTCTVLAFCPSVLRKLHKIGLGLQGQEYLRQVSCNGQRGYSVCCQDNVYEPSFIPNNIPNVVSKYPPATEPPLLQTGGINPSRPDTPLSNPTLPPIPTNPPDPITQTEPPVTIQYTEPPVTLTSTEAPTTITQPTTTPAPIAPQAPVTPLIPPFDKTTLSPNIITQPIIITRPIPQNIQFAPPFEPFDEGVAASILPPAGRCGLSASEDRIVGGNETGLDQYPWMGLIEYDTRKGDVKVGCGSSLITNRYVVTAAHCVSRTTIQRVGIPLNVRLGEFDKRLTIDCLPLYRGRQECNDRPARVPIEAIISHPNYNEAGGNHRNDIALIRLAYDAPYTDFIRPICLPPYDITQRVGESFELTVAGWGTTERGGSSNRKLHVHLPLVDTKMCQFQYIRNGLKVSLWEHQICAGGVLGKDSCRGDSGGPLMMQEIEGQFVLHGIVSFGPTPCARANVPGVYTKVAAYVPWIKSQIKY